jgi:DNA mismatch endonuclease (patch repair protein)
VDTLTKAERSSLMSRVRGKNTKPEMVVRRVVSALGYRYRLHVRVLPGSPDLVFPSLRKVIFVHGCFWHQHRCKMGNRVPKSRVRYWKAKLARNRQRDANQRRRLRRLGWHVMTIWECETRPARLDKVRAEVVAFLGRQDSASGSHPNLAKSAASRRGTQPGHY